MRSATHATNQALLFGFAISLLATILSWTCGDWFARAMQLEPEAAALTTRYLKIVAFSLPFLMLEQVAAACLRGVGDTWTGFQAKVVVNIFNVFFCTMFVVGYGPFPKLGWDGLAWGTALAHVVAGVILLVLLLRGRSGLRITRSDLVPDWPLLKRIARVGVPGGCDQLAVIFCHLIYASIINGLGTVAAAAHGLGLQIEALSYLPGLAFQIAAVTIAGQALGAKDPRAATQGVMRAWFGATVIMSCSALVFYFCGWWLTQFFNGGEANEVTDLATRLLKIVPFGGPFLAALQVLTGGLRGAGDTRWPLAITFFGFLFIRIPFAAILAWPSVPLPFLGIEIPGANWGVQGAWIAMVSDVIIRSLLVMYRFFRGDWRFVVV
jgi:putative MATE family efflux protein